MVRLFCNFPLLSIAVRFVRARARLLVGREKEHTETPDETNVFKSGPLTKTSIHTVFRGRLRRRDQTKRNLSLAFQFVFGPPPPGPQTDWKASGG